MTPFTNLTFNFSGLIPMNKKYWVLWIFIFLAPLGCGVGIGNGLFGDPTAPSASFDGGPDLDFSAPIDEYNESTFDDCGSFTEDSTIAQVDAGRECIHDAFDACNESKYLYNKTNADGSQFVSFVSVEITSSEPLECQLRVHTVSDVPPENIGDEEKTCTTFDSDELPEVACGIE